MIPKIHLFSDSGCLCRLFVCVLAMEDTHQGQSLLDQRDVPGRFAHQFPQDAEGLLLASGKYDAVNFSSVGPAGIFALYSSPTDPVGLVFLNEFISVWSHPRVLKFEPST